MLTYLYPLPTHSCLFSSSSSSSSFNYRQLLALDTSHRILVLLQDVQKVCIHCLPHILCRLTIKSTQFSPFSFVMLFCSSFYASINFVGTGIGAILTLVLNTCCSRTCSYHHLIVLLFCLGIFHKVYFPVSLISFLDIL